MPVFHYKAGREDGSIVTKDVESESEEQLRRELEDAGLLVFEVKKRASFGLGSFKLRKKMKSEEFLIFNQELLALIRAGLPIVQSLDLLTERTQNPEFRDVLLDIKTELRGGKALSDAMAEHPRQFPELYTNSLKAGEKTGDLPNVIERYIDYLKRLIGIKRQIKTALTYPTFLVIITVGIISFLLIYVVPSFSSIYADSKAKLPVPTMILLNTTTFLKSYFWLFAMAMAGLLYLFRLWYSTESGRRAFDGWLLRVPLIGPLIRGYITSSMSRTLSTILAGGIPMLQALDMVARSVTNREFSRCLKYTQDRVREGASLAGALEETKILPPMTIRMIEVGEATGSLETMLNDISNFYEEEVNVSVIRVTSLIEPMMMLVMGIVVGGIVIIMYLPIFELAGTVN